MLYLSLDDRNMTAKYPIHFSNTKKIIDMLILFSIHKKISQHHSKNEGLRHKYKFFFCVFRNKFQKIKHFLVNSDGEISILFSDKKKAASRDSFVGI